MRTDNLEDLCQLYREFSHNWAMILWAPVDPDCKMAMAHQLDITVVDKQQKSFSDLRDFDVVWLLVPDHPV